MAARDAADECKWLGRAGTRLGQLVCTAGRVRAITLPWVDVACMPLSTRRFRSAPRIRWAWEVRRGEVDRTRAETHASAAGLERRRKHDSRH
jgi:hypothetical protein